MLSDIFQRQYDFEHLRRGEVTSAAGTPIVAVTVLSSAVAVALLDFPYIRSTLTIAFTTLVGLALSVYYIFRSIWNYVYRKLPPAPALSAHLKELEAWHLAQGCDASKVSTTAEKDFREYIDDRLSEAADWNGQNNDRRGNFLHMGTTALAFSLAMFVPTALLYAYGKATTPDKVHRVELTQPLQHKEKEMTTTPSNGTNTPASTPAATPSAPLSSPATTQVKPAGPPNSSFRTNTELPSPQANRSSQRSGN